MNKFLRIIAACVLILTVGCSNIFTAMSQKNSDEALLQQAKMQIDQLDYSGAITTLNSTSSAFQARTDVLETFAGAYAGKCGFNFVNFVSSLSGSPSGSFMAFLMNAWTQKTISPSDCTTAESYVKTIGATSALRTADENFFMAVLAMAKIGMYMRYKADVDGPNNLGNGVTDGTFNFCTASASFFTDADIKEIMTGLALMINNLTYVTASLGGAGALASVNTLSTTCATLGNPSPCSYENASSITDANSIKAVRNFLSSSSSGIGTDQICP